MCSTYSTGNLAALLVMEELLLSLLGPFRSFLRTSARASGVPLKDLGGRSRRVKVQVPKKASTASTNNYSFNQPQQLQRPQQQHRLKTNLELHL